MQCDQAEEVKAVIKEVAESSTFTQLPSQKEEIGIKEAVESSTITPSPNQKEEMGIKEVAGSPTIKPSPAKSEKMIADPAEKVAAKIPPITPPPCQNGDKSTKKVNLNISNLLI